MFSVQDLTDFFESQFHFELQEQYDNSGLIIGNTAEEVKSVLVCLNVTHEVIDEAKARACNVIVSHHPLIFNGLKKITGSSDTERMVEKIIKNHIAVYALHTNADNAFPGLNSFIADKLGLTDVKVLSPLKGMLRKLVTFCPENHAEQLRTALFQAGAGVIGNYDSCSFNSPGTGTFRGSEITNPFVGSPGELHKEKEIKIETVFPAYLGKKVIQALLQAHPYEEVAYDIYRLENEHHFTGTGCVGNLEKAMKVTDFLNHVKMIFGSGFLKYSGSSDIVIRRVALCGGSGASFIRTAFQSGADAYITSDLKYHDFQQDSFKFLLVDAGHYETELFFKEYIVSILTKKFTNFAIYFAESEKNHVFYY